MASSSLMVDAPIPGVRVLTLNRPEKRNAIDRELFGLLIAALEQLDSDDSVKVGILTGAGPAFCAGVDLADVADHALLEQRRLSGISPPGVLLNVGVPVIGAINGPCVTGGLELALACDFLVAAEQASFADSHVKLGLLPSWGGAGLLPAAVGIRNAKRLALTGVPISAQQAKDMGLVSEVVSGEHLLARALSLAQIIAAASPERVRQLLDIYDLGDGAPRAERLLTERTVLLESHLGR